MKKTVKKPVKKTVTKQKKPVCKPCKPCTEQHIYHHIRRDMRGENIGNLSLSDIKRGISVAKDTVKSYIAPQPTSRVTRPKRPLGGTGLKPTTIPPRPTPPPSQPLPQPLPQPMPQPVSQPAPQQPQGPPSVASQWKSAFANAGQVVKTKAAQAVTPQGTYNIAKAGATGAYQAGKFAVDKTYEGMVYLDRKRLAQKFADKKERERKLEQWRAIPYEQRQHLLEEQAMRQEQALKLRRMRQQAEDYQLDKADAYLTGRKFSPRVFKVETSGRWGDAEEKYMDEYGRELPGYTEEVTKPKGMSRQMKTEAKEIGDIFGFTSGRSARSIPSPLTEPSQSREIMGAEVYDQPRRRVRYASEPPQYSSQRRISGGVSPQREADDVRRLLM